MCLIQFPERPKNYTKDYPHCTVLQNRIGTVHRIQDNSLVDGVDDFQPCTAFICYEFDSRDFQQLFGSPSSMVYLR